MAPHYEKASFCRFVRFHLTIAKKGIVKTIDRLALDIGTLLKVLKQNHLTVRVYSEYIKS